MSDSPCRLLRPRNKRARMEGMTASDAERTFGGRAMSVRANYRRPVQSDRICPSGRDALTRIAIAITAMTVASQAWRMVAPCLRAPGATERPGGFLDLILFPRALHGTKFTRRHSEVPAMRQRIGLREKAMDLKGVVHW